MEPLEMYVISLVCVGTGILIGLINWYLGINRLIKKSGPSTVMLVPLILMILGVALMPEQPLTRYLWLALIIDFSALPMLTWIVISTLLSRKNT